jgi:hypothetical protein
VNLRFAKEPRNRRERRKHLVSESDWHGCELTGSRALVVREIEEEAVSDDEKIVLKIFAMFLDGGFWAIHENNCMYIDDSFQLTNEEREALERWYSAYDQLEDEWWKGRR